MTLTDLPPELLDAVIELIPSRRDLKRLCEVSTHLYARTMPFLYRSVILSAQPGSLDKVAVVLERISHRCSQYTKDFGFDLLVNLDPPAYPRKPGCLHRFGGTDRNSDPFLKFNRALDLVKFPDDQLQSFRWHLSTCLPRIPLGYKGSILGNQGNLRSISLITDGRCVKNEQNVVHLLHFKKLQYLRWIGLNQYFDFESVSAFIKAHGHQIKSLTLDLLDDSSRETWAHGFLFYGETFKHEEMPVNFFAQRVINVNPGDRRLVFNSLENLDLSAVRFYGMGNELIHALNIENLKSLRLRRCPGSLRWLRKILKSGKSMNLKSFEFSIPVETDELLLECKYLGEDGFNMITEVISGIILHNVKLESIRLMIPSDIDWDILTDALLVSGHHRLVDLVLHPLHDPSNLLHRLAGGPGRVVDAVLSWKGSSLKSLLQGSRLNFFGSTAIPRHLTHHFQNMEPRPSFKVLHLRVSEILLSQGPSCTEWHHTYKKIWDIAGYFSIKYANMLAPGLENYLNEREDVPIDFMDDLDEIFSFAKWAFSADGLPNLQVIAGGDFAYQGRSSTINIMLCRADNAHGCELLTSTDEAFQKYLKDNMEILGACPWDDIM
ncbi:hypothetical protein N7540_011353 [Penicillium herquei]|nr:hypothetical protein N7540_011353 [Penicillium herquei]